MASRRVSVPSIRSRKNGNKPVVMVTAYDALFARMADEAGVDIILVGDSVGTVVQGLDNTLEVELDDIIYHCRAVARGASRAHIVGDMPFMTYQLGPEQALDNAGKLIKKGRAESIKLEGGAEVAPSVQRIVAAGIPVMGHIGLTPQSIHAMGGHRIQGRSEEARTRLVADARALVEAGAYAIVLEGIPLEAAEAVTAAVDVPTIGIGAGPHCDGQVLVLPDLLGLTDRFRPRFLKRYESFADRGRAAIAEFIDEVHTGAFPAPEHSHSVVELEGRARLASVVNG
jgi:3-methyl-2-oxobutanoate hydroxymethyltransferase